MNSPNVSKKKPRIPKYYKDFCAAANSTYLRMDLEKKCRDDRLHYLDYVLTNDEIKKPPPMYERKHQEKPKYNYLDDLMKSAVENNAFQVMEYLLESPKLKKHACINYALEDAFNNNNIDVMKFLLSSDNLTKHGDIEYFVSSSATSEKNDQTLLIHAAKKGNLEMVDFLLSDPALKMHADIHAQNDKAVYHAILNGHVEVVKYLLSSNKITDHATLYGESKNEFAALMFTSANENKEMADYLIIEYGMKKTDVVNSFFKDSEKTNEFDNYMFQLFEKRELYETLENSLENKKGSQNRIKL